MLAEVSSIVWITLGAAFIAVSALAYWVASTMSGDGPRAEKRLEALSRRRRAGDILEAAVEKEKKKAEALASVLEKAERFSKPLQPKTAREIGKLQQRLMWAGLRTQNAAAVFLGIKFVCLMTGLLIGGGASVFLYGFTTAALVRLVVVAGIAFFIPELILGFVIKRRKEQVFLGLPDALDLMVVCVEAGLGLDQAMRKVSEEMKKSYRAIADEFGMCNLQLQMGRPRSEVLADLGIRSGVDDLRSLAGILIQADKFGSSIAQALRVQSDAMRTKRRQLAEEKAAKCAVKLIFPLVIFIFPGIFVVLVGPAAITMMNKML